jgi:hypothetical protein
MLLRDFFLFPLLEERARERGGFSESTVRSTPHPNPPLKGEGVKPLCKTKGNHENDRIQTP